MAWYDKITKVFGNSEEKKKIAKREVIEETLTGKDKEKALATLDEEPWVKVLQVNFDPENPSRGYFELDWNEPFVQKLAESGYTGQNNEEIVDQWFTDLCKGIARTQTEAGGFVADEDVIRMSDLQKAENKKSDKGKPKK